MEIQENKNVKLEPATFEELEQLIHEKFEVKDTGIVRLLCATVIAHLMPGDPVWLFLVAPPSGLKTELIRALDGIDFIYNISSLTPHTLISGQKGSMGKETSLLFKIPTHILTFKDFTSILEMNYNARDEILSQLREVYDGQYSKSFGTGEEIKWEGKIGFIAGVTEAVDLFQEMYNILGERFLQYRMAQPDRKDATRKGMQNASKIHEIRLQAKEMFARYIKSVEVPKESPEISSDLREEIIELSDFATLAREGVVRDPKTREITNVFAPEMPIRFAKQLALLAQSFLLMGLKENDRNIMRKIAFSSLSKNRLKAFWYLSQERNKADLSDRNTFEDDENMGEVETGLTDNEKQWTSKDIGIAMGLPTTTARRILEEINALGFVERKKSSSADAWKLKEIYKVFFRKYYSNEFKLFDS